MCRPVVFHADLGDAVALMAPPVASKLNFRYPVNPPFPKPANAAALQKECENRPAARGRNFLPPRRPIYDTICLKGSMRCRKSMTD